MMHMRRGTTHEEHSALQMQDWFCFFSAKTLVMIIAVSDAWVSSLFTVFFSERNCCIDDGHMKELRIPALKGKSKQQTVYMLHADNTCAKRGAQCPRRWQNITVHVVPHGPRGPRFAGGRSLVSRRKVLIPDNKSNY